MLKVDKITQTHATQQKLESNDDPFKRTHPAGWDHCVILETKDRKYELFSNDYNFKELFVYSLRQLLSKRETAFQVTPSTPVMTD